MPETVAHSPASSHHEDATKDKASGCPHLPIEQIVETHSAILGVASPLRTSQSKDERVHAAERRIERLELELKDLRERAALCALDTVDGGADLVAARLASQRAREETEVLWAAAVSLVDPAELQAMRQHEASARFEELSELEKRRAAAFWDILRECTDELTFTNVARRLGGGPVSVAKRLFQASSSTSSIGSGRLSGSRAGSRTPALQPPVSAGASGGSAAAPPGCGSSPSRRADRGSLSASPPVPARPRGSRIGQGESQGANSNGSESERLPGRSQPHPQEQRIRRRATTEVGGSRPSAPTDGVGICDAQAQQRLARRSAAEPSRLNHSRNALPPRRPLSPTDRRPTSSPAASPNAMNAASYSGSSPAAKVPREASSAASPAAASPVTRTVAYAGFGPPPSPSTPSSPIFASSLRMQSPSVRDRVRMLELSGKKSPDKA